jgi:integrase
VALAGELVPAGDNRNELASLADRAAEFGRHARSASSERAYRSDWADFQAWCQARAFSALPATPVTIGLYLTDRSGSVKVSTLRRRLVAIKLAHRVSRVPLDMSHPAIREVFAGIRRELGTRPEAKRALMDDELKAALRRLPRSRAGQRDKALLLFGFAGAFRRSEIAAISLADLSFTHRGVAIVVRRSKTDQEGSSETIGIARSGKATCPVAALEAWIAAAELKTGTVFRAVDRHDNVHGDSLTGDAVNRIVKRTVALLGLDPGVYGAHSLRSGFCTSASAHGADIAEIMKQSRHRSIAQAKHYVQDGQIFRNRAVRAISL